MLVTSLPGLLEPLRAAINYAYRMDETECVEQLLSQAHLPQTTLDRIAVRAKQLISGIRDKRRKQGGLDAFLIEYDLSSEEGIALMCLAEALLRIPDNETIDNLISDKIGKGAWEDHLGQSHSVFVNAMTWGLMLTGKIMAQDRLAYPNLQRIMSQMLTKSGMPAIRLAVKQMMKIMSQQFVMAETIEAAIKRARSDEKRGYLHSYDMLGEAARTQADAERYFAAYQHAITTLAEVEEGEDIFHRPGISIKLSALHPRYEFSQRERVLKELTPKLLLLAQQAKKANINLTVDAEEAVRLDLSLDIIEAVFTDKSLHGWEGFGLAVQSYQKRAISLLDWLAALARGQQRRLMIRLIKGAYWDSEIKYSQIYGLNGYPVFTRKYATDVSFVACARKILSAPDAFYPQFATHNAYSLATILELVGNRRNFEFQCLHGMGHPLYDQIVGEENLNIPCRVYAPVGGYRELLSYLVRRLLENGANTSFVNRIADDSAPIEDLIVSPMDKLEKYKSKPHPRIPLPKDIYGPGRLNAKSFDLSDANTIHKLAVEMTSYLQNEWRATPMLQVTATYEDRQQRNLYDPSNTNNVVGTVVESSAADIENALQRASRARMKWDNTPVTKRAEMLNLAAELLEKKTAECMTLLVREAGKTIPDALSEVREAIDFCRYYAVQAKQHLANPTVLQGPTGEYNELKLHGRGVIVCISPWNFPLAIFLGQVTAALVAGNTVIAKPAEHTPLIAAYAIDILREAGIPDDVIQMLPGNGEEVGASLVADTRVSGIIFTGSTHTAKLINLTLAQRQGAIVPLIAETGGLNVMIADSSALAEQLVNDIIISAFGSAGQRCSALRVLYLPESIADHVLTMLSGAMAELHIGDPGLLQTDIGPVIDNTAQQHLLQHIAKMRQQAKLIYEVKLPNKCQQGHFVPPCAFEISSIEQLPEEVFGPVLHVIRYTNNELSKVIDDINNTGYGLTFGIQSRITRTVDAIAKQVKVGNCYVNRSMIGAVVGVQPFGGEGLSGTGPKAGGPHYLHRLCTERMISIDTTAAGGNATLLSLTD